jgi:hypothetical protein
LKLYRVSLAGLCHFAFEYGVPKDHLWLYILSATSILSAVPWISVSAPNDGTG